MARPIEFDRDQALRDAMLLFWRRGFHQTTVRNITDATQLQPGSLYSAFGSKRALFLEALDLYSAELKRFVEAVLRSDAPPLARIERFFSLLLEKSVDDSERRGCLLINTLLEMETEELEIGRRVAQALRMMERTVQEVLDEAAEQDELIAGADPQALARLLMTGVYGLQVYNRMRPKPEDLRGISETLVAMLRR